MQGTGTKEANLSWFALPGYTINIVSILCMASGPASKMAALLPCPPLIGRIIYMFVYDWINLEHVTPDFGQSERTLHMVQYISTVSFRVIMYFVLIEIHMYSSFTILSCVIQSLRG
jgi:hypothetical protein